MQTAVGERGGQRQGSDADRFRGKEQGSDADRFCLDEGQKQGSDADRFRGKEQGSGGEGSGQRCGRYHHQPL